MCVSALVVVFEIYYANITTRT